MYTAHRFRAPLALAALLVVACDAPSNEPLPRVERARLAAASYTPGVEGGDVVAVAPTWSATFSDGDGHRARVRVVPLGDTAVRATMELTGAASAGTHPWYLHRGTCKEDLGVVGNRRAYPPLTGAEPGVHRAVAVIPVSLDPRRSYFATIRWEGERVACGELKAEGN